MVSTLTSLSRTQNDSGTGGRYPLRVLCDTQEGLSRFFSSHGKRFALFPLIMNHCALDLDPIALAASVPVWFGIESTEFGV